MALTLGASTSHQYLESHTRTSPSNLVVARFVS